MDMMLPRISGDEVARLIEGDPELEGLPVVLIGRPRRGTVGVPSAAGPSSASRSASQLCSRPWRR